MSSLRDQVSTVSKPLLVRLSTLPRPLVPLIMVALAAVALFTPLPFAVPALALLFVFVGWLAYLSWPVLTPGAKLLRVLMVALLVGYGILRVTR